MSQETIDVAHQRLLGVAALAEVLQCSYEETGFAIKAETMLILVDLMRRETSSALECLGYEQPRGPA